MEATRVRFAFDDDLQSSRVYRMVKRNGHNHFKASSDVDTQAWSIFSGISLADISVLSVVALPLNPDDVDGHAQYYSFKRPESSRSEATATSGSNQEIIDDAILSSDHTIQLPLSPTHDPKEEDDVEEDDAEHDCTGCGDILEEGEAIKLGERRIHFL